MSRTIRPATRLRRCPGPRAGAAPDRCRLPGDGRCVKEKCYGVSMKGKNDRNLSAPAPRAVIPRRRTTRAWTFSACQPALARRPPRALIARGHGQLKEFKEKKA